MLEITLNNQNHADLNKQYITVAFKL